jgi:hypothetical protein
MRKHLMNGMKNATLERVKRMMLFPDVEVIFPENIKPGSPSVRFKVKEGTGKYREMGYTLKNK